MNGESIRGAVAGAGFELSCDGAAAAYARTHLAALLEGELPAPSVASTLRWHEALPPQRRSAGLAKMERVDRDLYIGDGRLCWYRVDDLRDLFLEMMWDGSALRL